MGLAATFNHIGTAGTATHLDLELPGLFGFSLGDGDSQYAVLVLRVGLVSIDSIGQSKRTVERVRAPLPHQVGTAITVLELSGSLSLDGQR